MLPITFLITIKYFDKYKNKNANAVLAAIIPYMLFICLTTEFLFLITSANASPLGHFCNCCSACCCFAIPKYNINLTAKGNNVV